MEIMEVGLPTPSAAETETSKPQYGTDSLESSESSSRKVAPNARIDDSNMTDAEKERLEEKREYNRKNAARARARTKSRIEELTRQVEMYSNNNTTLQEQNDQLSHKIEQLQRENHILRAYILNPSSVPTDQILKLDANPQFLSEVNRGANQVHHNMNPLLLMQQLQQQQQQQQQQQFNATGPFMSQQQQHLAGSGAPSNMNDPHQLLLGQMTRLLQQQQQQSRQVHALNPVPQQSTHQQPQPQHLADGSKANGHVQQPSTEESNKRQRV